MRPHEIDPSKPGPLALLRGEGDLATRIIAWGGFAFLASVGWYALGLIV